jgi:hypothetical protein
MTVRLESQDGSLDIKNSDFNEQVLVDGQETSWSFNVKLLSEGTHPLNFVILTRTKMDVGTEQHAVATISRDIRVAAKPMKAQIIEFALAHWVGFGTAIFIPTFAFFFNTWWERRKKRSSFGNLP